LRFAWCKAENGAMRAVGRFPALAIAILCLLLAGLPTAAAAQYRDRDLYKDYWPPAANPSADKRIDINHASLEQLLKAPGMTRSWAGRIVRFRPYRTKLDLVERGVVSGEVYARFKDYVVAHHVAQ
jgi:DNA uptake protein ComE-like DNA-binding protein